MPYFSSRWSKDWIVVSVSEANLKYSRNSFIFFTACLFESGFLKMVELVENSDELS
ncbi:MAG: hypothetical protein HY786_02880 [Deltaproteobacteria bacterium]|nr:hypothetical protein [Deltaproteobacteria bacterium]